jgi:hypothetical protein
MAGSAPKFVCVAKRVQPLFRFSATPQQLDAEARRKREALHYARTEMRAMQPNLVRETVPVRVDPETADIGAKIAAAGERAASVDDAGPVSRLAASVDDAGQASRLAGAGAGAVTEIAGGAELTAGLAGAGARSEIAGGTELTAGRKELRGSRAMMRAAVVSFGAGQFTLAEIRGKLPGALKERAACLLHALTLIGELRKTRRADGKKVWQATDILRVRGSGGRMTTIPSAGGPITCVLEQSRAGGVCIH